MKSIIAALLVTVATPAVSAMQSDGVEIAETVESTEAAKASAQIDEMMAMFSKMFDTSKLPAPDPARLKLAEVTASRLVPAGAFGKMVNDMIANIAKPILDSMPGLSDARIMAKTGASSEKVEALSAENKEAVTLIIDPNFRQRGDQLMSIMTPIINDVMADLEPAMRTGLSRAYARKFSTAELNGINGFFATPTGASFARENFALRADPEVLSAMVKAIPAILGKFMGDEKTYKAKFDALPKERKLSELSDAELEKLGSLLGITVQSLKDYQGVETDWASGLPECAKDGDSSDCTDADWPAASAAEAAVAAATEAAEAADMAEAEAKLRSAWSKADLKAVEQAEAARTKIWDAHAKIDAEVSDVEQRLQNAIDTAKRNAGQPVEADLSHDHSEPAADT